MTKTKTAQKQLKPWKPSFVWALRERNSGLWNKKGFSGLVGRVGVVYKAANHLGSHVTGTIKEDLLVHGTCDLGRRCKRCRRNARRRFFRRFEVVKFRVEEVR